MKVTGEQFERAIKYLEPLLIDPDNIFEVIEKFCRIIEKPKYYPTCALCGKRAWGRRYRGDKRICKDCTTIT